jgi:membrane-associated phospholipid phosphatase
MELKIFDWLVRIWWLFGGYIVLTTDKLDLHRKFNTFHTNFLDFLAQILTHVGDGFFVLLIVVLMAFKSLQKSLILLFIFLASSGIAQFLKHLVFKTAMRPMHFFQSDETFHKIPDFTYFFYNSFPSGHATSIFALCTFLAFLNQKWWQQILLFLVAPTIALTRVYLSQHFFEDVLIGSFIGFFTARYIFTYTLSPLEKWDKSVKDILRKS